jgi:uncharacterized protein YkwD
MNQNLKFESVKHLQLIFIAAFFCACAGNSPIITAPPTTPGTSTPPTTSLDAFNAEILNQVNAARATGRSCGAKTYAATKALAWNTKLEAAARAHNQDMLEHNFFSHTGSDGSTPWDRFKRQGYINGAGGENIAKGQQTVQSVMSAWLNSPGHCENIMNSALTDIGVAALFPAASPNSPYWTMDLASPR